MKGQLATLVRGEGSESILNCVTSFKDSPIFLEEDDERHSDDLGLTDLIDDFAPTDHFEYPTRPTRPPRSRRPQFSRPQRPPHFQKPPHHEDDEDEDYFPGIANW